MKKIIFIILILFFVLTPISLVVSNNSLLFTPLTTYAEEHSIEGLGSGESIDAFGDFSSGSAWDSWYHFSINPSNNALGAFLTDHNVTSQLEVEVILTNELDPLIENRVIHSQSDFVIAEQQKEDIKDITEATNATTNAQSVICEAFPNEVISTGEGDEG